jgi:hypothetical protein
MARVSNNAEADFVVLAWDGTAPGVTNGYDNPAEAEAEVRDLKERNPDNEYFALQQRDLAAKVEELTGTPAEAMTDPDKTHVTAAEAAPAQPAPAPAPSPASNG